MPGDATVQNVHLILFSHPEVDSKVLEFCNRFALMASTEYGARKHYHIAIHLPEEVCYKTFRTYLTKYLGDLKGTTSFKTRKWEDYGVNLNLEQYVCKGASPDSPPEMIMNKTLLDPLELQKMYWEVNKKLLDQAKQARDDKAKEEAKKGTKIIEQISAKNKGIFVKTEDIIAEVLECYGGRCSDHQMFPVVQAIMYRLDKVQTTDNVVNRLMRKFS